MRRLSLSFSLCALLSLPAQATIVTLADYHLGDFDPGAVSGNAANATIVDSSGNGNTLTLTGNATFATTPTGLGINFTGSGRYEAPVFSTITSNFGLEVLLYSTNVASDLRALLYNGDGAINGYGLVDYQGNRRTLLGGLTFGLSTPIVDNQWLSLAMVNVSGSNTLYVNGVAVASGLNGSGNLPSGNFTLGANFQGTMDRARFFTFTPGSFSTDDLITPVPEPASFALIGLGLAAIGYTQHRKRRA